MQSLARVFILLFGILALILQWYRNVTLCAMGAGEQGTIWRLQMSEGDIFKSL